MQRSSEGPVLGFCPLWAKHGFWGQNSSFLEVAKVAFRVSLLTRKA